MKRGQDSGHFSSFAVAVSLGGWLFPFSLTLAHDAPTTHAHQNVWMLALSPHAAVMLVLAFFAGMLAVYLRKSAVARVGLGAIAIALPLTSFTQIAVIPVPHTFADGQTASASQVNQNFQAVVQQIASHANNTDLHGGGEGVSSVDGLLGGTISGDVTVAEGTLYADQVGAGKIALIDEFDNPILVFSTLDGFVTMGVPGTSAGVSFSSDGDTRLDGRNTFVTGIDGSVVIENQGSGGITLTAIENTTVTTGNTTSITSGNSHNISAGDTTTIVTANSTNITSGGAASINANRIDLNAP